MALKKHKIIEFAESQLRTAIFLFLNKNDFFSAITLAGAADTLLCTLVTNLGKENFTSLVLKEEKKPNKTVTEMGREINDMYHINALKHMDADDDGIVTMDARESAVGAILKALPNYVIIRGQTDFVKAFLLWIKQNLDPKKYNVN